MQFDFLIMKNLSPDGYINVNLQMSFCLPSSVLIGNVSQTHGSQLAGDSDTPYADTSQNIPYQIAAKESLVHR